MGLDYKFIYKTFKCLSCGGIQNNRGHNKFDILDEYCIYCDAKGRLIQLVTAPSQSEEAQKTKDR